MGYFKHICLVEAPQHFEVPFTQFVSDIIGVCYLASAVVKKVETITIPENYYNSGIYESFERLLTTSPVDLVAISAMTGAALNAYKLAEIAKRYDKHVVMGGFHPSSLPEEVLRSGFVDTVVMGEGEATFRELVEKGPGKDVAGIAYLKNGRMVLTGPRPLITDADAIDFPFRSLRPLRYGERGDDYSMDTIFTSRGCPWTCSFCANHLVHKKWRARSPENVVEEIAMLHDPKRKKYLKIWDANFLTNIGRVEKICDLMIERGLTNFKIVTETRAKDVVISEPIMDKLYKIGLRKIGLGIESPNAKTLALMNKKIVIDDISGAIEIIRKHKMKSQGYFIIGHYSETAEDTKRYPAFARKLGLDQSIFMIMTPYPGTKIFKEYKDGNNIISYDWNRYNNFYPVIKTVDMTPQTIMQMLAYCYVSHSRYSSLLKSKKSFKAMYDVISRLLVSYNLLRMYKVIDKQDLYGIICDSFQDFITRTISLKPASLSRYKTKIMVRVRHSDAKILDFVIEQRGEIRLLDVKEADEKIRFKGPIIHLDAVERFAETLFPDTIMKLFYKGEVISNNRGSRNRELFWLLKEKDVRNAVLRFSGLMLSSYIGKNMRKL